MEKRIIDIYITDVALHANHRRPAATLAKAANKRLPDGQPYGRMYGPSPALISNGQFRIAIKLPADLQSQVDRGEVEINVLVPKGGLPVFPDNSCGEKIAQLEKKKSSMAIHRSKVWKSE